VIVDKFSGVSRGFGFVTMPDEGEAAGAIRAVNGSLVQESRLRVEASRFRPRVEWKGGTQR
jgi:RNA recognition motif-containing protein